jgi:hypothetical protein
MHNILSSEYTTTLPWRGPSSHYSLADRSSATHAASGKYGLYIST